MSDRYHVATYNLGERSEKVEVYEAGGRDTPLCSCGDLANAKLIVDALNAWDRRQKAMRGHKPTMAGVLRTPGSDGSPSS